MGIPQNSSLEQMMAEIEQMVQRAQQAEQQGADTNAEELPNYLFDADDVKAIMAKGVTFNNDVGDLLTQSVSNTLSEDVVNLQQILDGLCALVAHTRNLQSTDPEGNRHEVMKNIMRVTAERHVVLTMINQDVTEAPWLAVERLRQEILSDQWDRMMETVYG